MNMISDRDIDLCARALVELFGKDAPARATERAGDYVGQGNEDGFDFWTKIAKATQQLVDGETTARTE